MIPAVLLAGAAGSQVKHYMMYRVELFQGMSSGSQRQLTGCVLCSTYNRLLLPAAPLAAMKRTDAIFEDVLVDSLLRQWGV